VIFIILLTAITWEYRTAAPASRTYPAIGDVTATNTSGHACIYIIGGQSALSQTTTNYEYDCVANSWTTRAQMPAPARYDFAGCHANRAGIERIYVFGGYQSVYIYLTDVDEYTPSTNTWISRADMPTQREGVRAACIGNMIYAIGGDYFDLNNFLDYVYDIVERYDPETNTWTTGYALMPTPRTDACCAVATNEFGDSCIYVFGGSTSILGYVATNAVEEYDPAADTWRVRNAGGFTARGGAVAVTDMNNLIYVIGGTSNGSNSLSLVQVYNPVTNTWISETAIQSARDGVTGGMAGDIGGHIHVVVGSSGATPLSTNERSVEIVNVDEVTGLAPDKRLVKIDPNPFASSTEIIVSAEGIDLRIYDASGREAKNFNLLTAYSPVPTIVHWDGKNNAGHDLPGGVYFLQAKIADQTIIEKIVKIK
jgi:N-acetylneuraminic acid mutarotase